MAGSRSRGAEGRAGLWYGVGVFSRASSSISIVSLTCLLALGCGDNPSSEGDEVASSSESAASTSESGSSGGETEASAGSSEATQTAGESSSSEGTATNEGTSTSESGSTDATETETGTTGDTEGPMPIAQCVEDCQQPSDCAIMDPAFNADNWECVGGACKWLGCSGNNECNPGFVCHDPGIGIASCVADCAAPSDCSQNFGPFITSNYVCDAGACVYLGCMDDGECAAVGSGFVCSSATWPVPTCVPPCFDASECTSPMPAYDFDNWSCIEGGCVWLGCKDGECGKSKVCLLE